MKPKHLQYIILICFLVIQGLSVKALSLEDFSPGNSSSIKDSWSFVVPINQHRFTSKDRSTKSVVKNGQKFGIILKFDSSKRPVRREVRLTVPDHPETFWCPKCNAGTLQSMDDNTVIVESEISSNEGLTGFYWGVDENDARGSYRMEILLDGVLAAAREFEVI